MQDVLLVTLRSAAQVRTLSFDPACQSLLWIGMGHAGAPRGAVASLECTERGMTLRTVDGVRLVVPGDKRGWDGPVLIDCAEPMMVGVERADGVTDASLYIRPFDEGMRTYRALTFEEGVSIVIGRGAECDVRYQSAYASLRHAKVTYVHGRFCIQDLRSGNGTFVNGQMVPSLQERLLGSGDVVQVLDLVLVAGDGFLLANCPPGVRAVQTDGVDMTAAVDLPHAGRMPGGHGGARSFQPAPWLSETMRVPSLSVDPPPDMPEEEPESVVMRIGPSFIMGLGSVWMGADAIAGCLRGEAVAAMAPRACMAVAMVGGMVVWPLISALVGRRQERQRELVRQERYVSYLDGVRQRLRDLAREQEQTLRDRHRPLGELLGRAREQSPLLMSHTSEGDGFLNLRVGVCNRPLEAHVSWPQHHFSLRDDALWAEVEGLRDSLPVLRDVPAWLDVRARCLIGVVGVTSVTWEFLRGIVAQVCALYSYVEVKVALVCGRDEKDEWEPLSFVRHAYDAAGAQCLVALTPKGIDRIDAYVAHAASEGAVHLVVICTNPELLGRLRCAGNTREAAMPGVSVFVAGTHLHALPRECELIVDLGDSSGASAQGKSHGASMFTRSDVGNTTVSFLPDILTSREQAWQLAHDLSGVRLATAREASAQVDALGFLELFEMGNTGHLNVGQRWARNDSSRSLAVPVGAGPDGRTVVLDLHERADGPHGLIAGTTGSGKSEFILTLVLSLCVCFSPDEVSFVLIDYKGGGLADAFDNGRHRLPHLAGTITNLDGREIGRALASLGGELVRRQEILRSARDALGEATMDIHRYLSLYRQGAVSEPLPHLFIIADEFAELKQQEPAFMDELMSAARIGRSLGVHLILATQKPAGVVDNQIWANARLKVALKVSDADDSREMIRRDDAAHLSRPGAFCLLVGYDESFGVGHAAYAGWPYTPRQRFERRRDDAVELLDDERQVVASLRPATNSARACVSELDAIVAEVSRVGAASGMAARRLWLDPLPAFLPEETLAATYASCDAAGPVAVIGEVDDPANQCRHGLLVDFSSTANVLLLGTQGADVEGLLRALLVSVARRYGSGDVWMYAVDMGEGALLTLAGLPHVGGVVRADDEERIAQLFRLVEAEMARRLEGAGERTLIMAVANLASFLETYPDYEDRLMALARDGSRAGVHVVATVDGVASVRSRLRNCFDRVVPTMLADESDYAYLFGVRPTVPPPQAWRRGLVRYGDRVLEFQGAVLGASAGEERDYVDVLAVRMSREGLPQAPAIPHLPETVTYRQMGCPPGVPWVPIGYARELVEPVYLSLNGRETMLVVGNDQRALKAYVRGVLRMFEQVRSQSFYVLDPLRQLGSLSGACVASCAEEASRAIEEPEGTLAAADVVIVMGVPQALYALSAQAHTLLGRMIEGERTQEGPALVLCCEAWRLAGLYDDWYRAASAQGRGLWVGDGFAEQTILRVPRLTPSLRAPAKASDGFLVEAGTLTRVRLMGEEKL